MTDGSNLTEFKPTCPVIFFERATSNGKQIYTIHCEKLNVDVECYVSTAIIKLDGEWTNRTGTTLDCVFALPTPGTVMNVTLRIGPERVLTTAIVSRQEAEEIMRMNHSGEEKNALEEEHKPMIEITPEESNPYEQYVPDLFRLPFGNIKPGDVIRLSCEYLETLDYYKKGYLVSIPLYFPPGTIIENVEWHNVVNVSCKINALSPDLAIDCWSHDLINTHQLNDIKSTLTVATKKCKSVKPRHEHHQLQQEQQNQALSFPLLAADANANANANEEEKQESSAGAGTGTGTSSGTGFEITSIDRTGRDFELSYSVRGQEIKAHCVHEKDAFDEQSGTLCLFMTPPTKLQTTFGRAFFFLIDRSGSMIGEPFVEATRALCRALDRLREHDQFNVCAYDHRQFYYESELVAANRDNVQNCKSWIHTYQPERGGTNMDVPIDRALDFLETCELLPFIVLITDGAVPNERDICVKLEKKSRQKLRTRFLTLGIGSYCNWFFLKMLSKIGRGFSDVVVYKEKIYFKIDHLLRMANTPVLTDIEISYAGLQQGSDIEIYPFPIPDLFIGSPVIVAAKYHANQCPEEILIRGYDPHGDAQQFTATVKNRSDLPVEKIFIKTQIDLMTSEAWLADSNNIRQKVISTSINNNMPSVFTSTIMFETTIGALEAQEAKLVAFDENDESEKDADADANANVNHSISERERHNRKTRALAKMKNNKKTVAALAIGGTAAIVAVTVMSFGSIQNTMANIPIMGGGADMPVLDDCCACFETCDCDCDCECDCDDCVIM